MAATATSANAWRRASTWRDILGGMGKVAEGVYTARSRPRTRRRMGIDMPITTEVYRVLYEGKDPRDGGATI